MAQRTHKIALDRSYLPIDPNTLPVTMHDTGREDSPEPRIPVIPFEGWNFMPTSYGWRSYFGISSSLGIDPLQLPLRCREIFVFQKNDLSNFLVALCDDGIWTKQGESSGAWTQAIVLTDPDDGTLLEWSHCILENELYVYRQGEASAYLCAAPTFDFVAHTPNTLNMAGQMGIFKAGGRLGFWDSADAVGYSALVDKTDFVPSVSTLANITTIRDLIGKIVNVLQHGDGFIIYGTKSIIGVEKDLSNTFLWKTRVISNIAGIAYRKQAIAGSPDTEHFAWTSIGLMRIRNFVAEIITPELYDFLKESQDPVYLKVLEGRYLALQLANEDYVDGIVSFFTDEVDPLTITLSEAQTLILALPDPDLVPTLTSTDGSWAMHAAGTYMGKSYDGNFVDYLSVPLDSLPDTSALNLTALPLTGLPVLPEVGNVPAVNTKPTAIALASIEIKEGAAVVDSYSHITPAHEAGPHVTLVELENANSFFARTKDLWDKVTAYQALYINTLVGALTPITAVSEEYSALSFHITDEDSTAGSNAHIQGVTGITSGNSALYGLPLKTVEAEIPFDFKNEWDIVKVGADDYAFHIARPAQVYNLSKTQTPGAITPIGPFIVRVTGGRASSGNSWSQSLIGLSGIEDEQIAVALFSGLSVANIGAAIDALIAKIAIAVPEIATTTSHIWWPADSSAQDPVYGMSQASLGIPSYKYRKIDSLQEQADKTGLTVTEIQVSVGTAGSNLADFDAISLDIYVHNNGAGGAFRDGIFNIQILGKFSTSETWADATTLDDYSANICLSPYAYVSYTKAAAAPINVADILATKSLCGTEALPASDHFLQFTIDPPGLVINWTDSIYYDYTHYPEVTFTFPGASFLMQDGSPAPYEVIWKGAYVYDIHLQRWGKMKNDYSQLLDFSPINSTALGTIPFTQFGVQAALLDTAGDIKLFDARPADSFLKFGKYGNFRQGFTTLEQVRADFRHPCSGTLEVEPSFDGRTVDTVNKGVYPYTDVTQIVQGHDVSARWHNIAFKGQFDLSYLELTSWRASRR